MTRPPAVCDGPTYERGSDTGGMNVSNGALSRGNRDALDLLHVLWLKISIVKCQILRRQAANMSALRTGRTPIWLFDGPASALGGAASGTPWYSSNVARTSSESREVFAGLRATRFPRSANKLEAAQWPQVRRPGAGRDPTQLACGNHLRLFARGTSGRSSSRRASMKRPQAAT